MKPAVVRKKAFSKFSLSEAYKQLNLKHLIPWTVSYSPIALSDAFQIHLNRLWRFDPLRSEEGKNCCMLACVATTTLQQSLYTASS
jgi:hypothetical protein